jgi:hypothetical protein
MCDHGIIFFPVTASQILHFAIHSPTERTCDSFFCLLIDLNKVFSSGKQIRIITTSPKAIITRVDLVKAFVVFERFVMESEVHVDGTVSRPLVESMRPQDVLQSKEINVGPECHLTHTVCVEVELVLNDFAEMLKSRKKVFN